MLAITRLEQTWCKLVQIMPVLTATIIIYLELLLIF